MKKLFAVVAILAFAAVAMADEATKDATKTETTTTMEHSGDAAAHDGTMAKKDHKMKKKMKKTTETKTETKAE